jgi:hypothetical protein
VVGGGVECVVTALDVVVVGIDDVVVVCVALCTFALCLIFFFAVVLVVAVVGVVNALAAVLELDDDPQPAAISASEARPAHRIGSRLICILERARRLHGVMLPEA